MPDRPAVSLPALVFYKFSLSGPNTFLEMWWICCATFPSITYFASFVTCLRLIEVQGMVKTLCMCPGFVVIVWRQERKQDALWLFVLDNLAIFYFCPSLALYPVNDAQTDLKFNSNNSKLVRTEETWVCIISLPLCLCVCFFVLPLHVLL